VLPRSLMQLNSLQFFNFDGQTLCAPADDTFQGWLNSIPDVRGPTCVPLQFAAAEHESLPESFTVHGNYPNPFRESTRLVFDLPWPASVTVEVMDITGRRVFTVPAARKAAGWKRTIPLSGRAMPSGLYLYRLTATSPEGNSVHTGSFVRIK